MQLNQATYALSEPESNSRIYIDFLASQMIEWKVIPQHALHFRGLCEAAVEYEEASEEGHRGSEVDL